MQVCAAVSIFLAAERAAVFGLVRRRMDSLAAAEKAILASAERGGQRVLDPYPPIDQASRDDLLFARLSPLLVLKLLPTEAFVLAEGCASCAGERVGMGGGDGSRELDMGMRPGGDEGDGAGGGDVDRDRGDGGEGGEGRGGGRHSGNADDADDESCAECMRTVFGHVQARLFNVDEFKPVREVSAEVFARMPPAWTAPHLLRALARVSIPGAGGGAKEGGGSAPDGQDAEDAARTAVLVVCFAMSHHGLDDLFRGLLRPLTCSLPPLRFPARCACTESPGCARRPHSHGATAVGSRHAH
jgi:hypothetical protein